MTEQVKALQATAVNIDQLYDLDQLRPGEPFELTWAFRNDGEAAWENSMLVYTDESFPETAVYPHTNPADQADYRLTDLGAGNRVISGDTVYVTVPFTAPDEAGTYLTGWQLQTAVGERFGPVREMRLIVVEAAEKALAGLSYDPVVFNNNAPDYNNIKAGQAFTGTWTIKNNGIDAWSGDFRAAYHANAVSGTQDSISDLMGVKATRSLYECTAKRTILPDEMINIQFNFTAPSTPGIYAFHWHMLDDSGQPFGGTRWMRIIVKQADGTAPPRPVDTGAYSYQGKAVTFFTGIHGPADDWMWQDGSFQHMMKKLDMPVFFLSDGANGDYAGFGDKTKNIIRLRWNPRPISAEEAYIDVRDDQLKRWWDRGYRRFVFFNEPQLDKKVANIEEGIGISWDNKEQFARFLGHCLRRAKQDFPDIQLFTTPMCSNEKYTPWGWRDHMWTQVKDVVDGWCMHAYSGDNGNADAAAQNIVNQIIELQRRYGLKIPIIISESSVNRGTDAEQKARVAHLLHRKLAQIPGVEGIFWYAADWSKESDHNHEGWFRNGIADAYMRQRNTA